MAYADLLEKEGIDSQYLAILSPKKVMTGFALVSGSTYSVSFSSGYVSKVQQNGSELTEALSSTLSAGEFFYDSDAALLYVRMSDSSSPSTKTVTANFDLYFGTKDEHWYRDPLDTDSEAIYFEAKVKKTPEIKLDISDALVGFQPVQRSQIQLINTDHLFEALLYDSSFSKAPIQIYNALRARVTDDLDVLNIKLVYDGFCGAPTYNGGDLQIETVSGEDELAAEFRNAVDTFYDTTTFPSLDPNKAGAPIRYVYGVVDGFVPINVDFTEYSTATTSDNRVWSVIGEQTNLANVTVTVGGGVHTLTKTFITSLDGLRVGDSVHLDRAAGTDEYVIILTVGANFITHVAIASPMADGDTVKRSFVGNVFVVQAGVIYQPLFGRDYSTSGALSGGCAGFTFTNNFEATLSMDILTPNDKIFCRVYGRKNDLTLGGPAFGADDSETDNLANTIMVVLDLLKRVLEIPESRINTASFAAAYALRSDALGFAIPDSASSRPPKVKDVLSDIIESSLLKIYIDGDLKWAVDAVEPLTASVMSIDDTEILKKSLTYTLDYKDIISDVVVEYAEQEESVNQNQSDQQKSSAVATSTVARYLHGIDRSKTVKSLHFKASDAQTLANRQIYLYGDRQGTVTFKAKNRFFETAIGDVLEVSRTKMLGFDYDIDVERTRSFSVVTVNKNRTTVTISAVDQKGIEDNSGSW